MIQLLKTSITQFLAQWWPWQVSQTGEFCSISLCCVSVCQEMLSMCCLMSGRSTAWLLLMLLHHFPSHQSLLISWASVHFICVLAVSTKQNLPILTEPLGKNQQNYNFMTDEFKNTPGDVGNIKSKTVINDDFLFTCLCKVCWYTSSGRSIISFGIMEETC